MTCAIFFRRPGPIILAQKSIRFHFLFELSRVWLWSVKNRVFQFSYKSECAGIMVRVSAELRLAEGNIRGIELSLKTACRPPF